MTDNGTLPADTLYMRRALELAHMGEYGASPNPMVGAVIVAFPDADGYGMVLGEGFHARCGGPHAEVRAVESVPPEMRSLIEGSTVYVTLEPCAHYGRTPPCAAMLVRERVGRVVVGCADPFAKVDGRGIAMLREAGIHVDVGVLGEECRWINRRFFTCHTLKRPYVTLKWACSADGWIDRLRTPGEPAARFSTPLTTLAVMQLRARHDAIAVGGRTVLMDNPSLNVRGVDGRSPVRVVYDRRHVAPSDARVFSDSDSGRTIVFDDPRISLDQSLTQLYERGITSLLVEGGASLLNEFLAKGLWDEVRRETSPCVLGSDGAVNAPSLPAGLTRTLQLDGRTITTVYAQTRSMAEAL